MKVVLSDEGRVDQLGTILPNVRSLITQPYVASNHTTLSLYNESSQGRRQPPTESPYQSEEEIRPKEGFECRHQTESITATVVQVILLLRWHIYEQVKANASARSLPHLLSD